MTLITKKRYENATPGVHDAGLLEVTEKLVNGKQLLRLKFLLKERDSTGNPKEVSCLCSKSLGRRSKLSSIIAPLNGGIVPDAVDLDEYIGRECQLVVSHRRAADGTIWDQIDSFLPPRSDAAPVETPPGRLFDPAKTRQSFTLPSQAGN